jgi:hypothetical protein
MVRRSGGQRGEKALKKLLRRSWMLVVPVAILTIASCTTTALPDPLQNGDTLVGYGTLALVAVNLLALFTPGATFCVLLWCR